MSELALSFLETFFNPENLFSWLFFCSVVGAGWWFARHFWPWWASMKIKEQNSIDRLADEIVELKGEITKLLEAFQELV